MNLHEYQAKSILKEFGVPIIEGQMAETVEEAVRIAKELEETTGAEKWAVKAQIHAGGRGKGGGVKIASNLEEVKSFAWDILGMTLVTHQTGPEGKLVRKLLVERGMYYPGPDGKVDVKEFYMSILLNRKTGKNIIMYSTEGGMDIETVAKETPHLIFTEEIEPGFGIQAFQARKIASNLKVEGVAFKNMVKFVIALYKAYAGIDATMVEINPVAKTSDDLIMAADAKVNLDDNGLFRHPVYAEMRDIHEEDAAEVEASRYNLNFVKLDGNVGCMVNGAGLAMATMDMIKLYGGDPANFLDIGGSSSPQKVIDAMNILLSDKNVNAVMINIFGGITRCDDVARGLVAALDVITTEVPIVIRLSGTNAKEGLEIIEKTGLPVVKTMSEAAKKAIELSKK